MYLNDIYWPYLKRKIMPESQKYNTVSVTTVDVLFRVVSLLHETETQDLNWRISHCWPRLLWEGKPMEVCSGQACKSVTLAHLSIKDAALSLCPGTRSEFSGQLVPYATWGSNASLCFCDWVRVWCKALLGVRVEIDIVEIDATWHVIFISSWEQSHRNNFPGSWHLQQGFPSKFSSPYIPEDNQLTRWYLPSLASLLYTLFPRLKFTTYLVT